MFTSSSPKHGGVPLTLIILIANLALFGERAEALKCYMCTCYMDCILNKMLFQKVLCESRYNTCLTNIKYGDPHFIQKFCWIAPRSMTEYTDDNTGITNKICHTDYCNDMDYEGFAKLKSSGSSGPSGSGPSEGTTAGNTAKIAASVPLLMVSLVTGLVVY